MSVLGKQRGSWVTGYFIKAVPPLFIVSLHPGICPSHRLQGTGEHVGCVAMGAEEAGLSVPGLGMTEMCDISQSLKGARY